MGCGGWVRDYKDFGGFGYRVSGGCKDLRCLHPCCGAASQTRRGLVMGAGVVSIYSIIGPVLK
jgi:hypothetical protein